MLPVPPAPGIDKIPCVLVKLTSCAPWLQKGIEVPQVLLGAGEPIQMVKLASS